MSLARFTCPLATVHADDTVEAAARTMRDRKVGSLLLLRAGHPVGIVTDRDLAIRVMAEGRDASKEKVGDFVTYDPITIAVHEGIETAVALMRRHGVRRLPLVDEAGMAIGMVTADDLLVLLGGEVGAICDGIENRADADDSR